MAIQFNNRIGEQCSSRCIDKFGCPSGQSPDFVIRRHDTKPAFKVSVEDCDGPLDLRGLIVEVNMWAVAKLRDTIAESDTYFRLADNVGFEQVMVGDIIVMDRVRMPEHMLVTGFDENNKLIQVERGYRGTTVSSWKKGNRMRIFRIMDAPAETEMEFVDIQQVDGTVDKDVNAGSYLVYEWSAEDTCLPGCYWMEFKLLKMKDVVYFLPGGKWVGEFHKHTDGFFYTGSINTDSSVRLSYNQVDDIYLLPSTPWTGELHHQDGVPFTGTVHNDGSVLLNQTGVPQDSNGNYDDSGLVSALSLDISLIPSFTDPSLSPYYFGCVLGEGVEWAQRFPVCGEGFLIKIEDSPTSEIP
jgi:hypothetical protein